MTEWNYERMADISDFKDKPSYLWDFPETSPAPTIISFTRNSQKQYMLWTCPDVIFEIEDMQFIPDLNKLPENSLLSWLEDEEIEKPPPVNHHKVILKRLFLEVQSCEAPSPKDLLKNKEYYLTQWASSHSKLQDQFFSEDDFPHDLVAYMTYFVKYSDFI